MKAFLVDNSGAVSVEWIMLTAVAVTLVTAGLGTVSTSTLTFSGRIETSIADVEVGSTAPATAAAPSNP